MTIPSSMPPCSHASTTCLKFNFKFGEGEVETLQSDEGMKVRLEVGDALEGASEEGVFKIIRLQGSSKRWSPGCVNAAGKARQKW